MGKIVQARKLWKCDCCDMPIRVGERYIYGKARYPRYDKSGDQCGIKFCFYRVCADTEACAARANKNEKEQKP